MSANAIETLGDALDELAIWHTDGDADVAEARAALAAVEALLEAAKLTVRALDNGYEVMPTSQRHDALAAAVCRVESGQ